MRALILLNLGSPRGGPTGPSEEQVRDYLAEFLMDPYVIDLPAPLRWALVHGIILRTRPKRSREAYLKIWSERGSPLRVHLEDLCSKLSSYFQSQGSDWIVRGAVRYGDPGIREALESVRGASEIVLFPLYPQYALATTQSSLDHARRAADHLLPGVPVRAIGPFYDQPVFIEAACQVAQESLEAFSADLVLFSFHGLPVRQVRRASKSTECLASADRADDPCCRGVSGANQNCYRAQCFETARLMARKLQLPPERFKVGFQSRFGSDAWIGPHTDELVAELARSGVRNLAVLCPSFVADCLETLEEIQIREREHFRQCGGENLLLVPSLNSTEQWIKSVAQLVLA